LVDLSDSGYELTSLGKDLAGKFASLDGWANDWAELLEKLSLSED
jgi:DNA-binding HxlR family transcriptional regulator